MTTQKDPVLKHQRRRRRKERGGREKGGRKRERGEREICNPSIQKAETGNLRLTWAAYQYSGLK